jgi:hypothetical protein
MDPIPWYRSNVLRGLLVAIVSYVLTLLGISERFPDVGVHVDNGLKFIEFAALAYSAWARIRSPIQPVVASQAAADRATLKLHPLAVALLCLVVLLPVLGACTALGLTSGQTGEQRASALLGDFTLYQKASLQVGSDETVLPEVRKRVLDAAIAAKPAADELDKALRQYRLIKRQLEAGETTDQKVAIAAVNLQNWIQQVGPLVTQLRTLVEGVEK